MTACLSVWAAIELKRYMKIDPEKVKLLRIAVEHKFGSSPGFPSDFDRLADEIDAVVGQRIGVSTLKRIWGYVQSSHTPTYTTLSLLSRYLGHRDWISFCNSLRDMDEPGNDSKFTTLSVVFLGDEPIGATFQLEWDAGKGCVIRKIANPSRFEILEARNIKLMAGDTSTIQTLALGQSMYAAHCCRGRHELGTYVGARNGGLLSIKRLDSE
ncbi:MAG TPA: hypothetical protein DCR26_00410 [Porphyromonadaceae bacterium]|nr:hypothetical protein [Porphyromonadaceae bacterium]